MGRVDPWPGGNLRQPLIQLLHRDRCLDRKHVSQRPSAGFRSAQRNDGHARWLVLNNARCRNEAGGLPARIEQIEQCERDILVVTFQGSGG